MSESHNPDVLSCLANLSNDEVFTPPKVVNDMLDLLPPELFKSSSTTFLDIGCKSGVFLREIAKRLISGLESEIPDLQIRVDHILHNQVYGIATTELTSLVSRRTLYCSKYPNCVYSTSRFDSPEGNIRFRNIPHTFVNGRCKWCGASESKFGKGSDYESHAYEVVHTDKPEKVFDMKFDVVVGNPPYQMSFGIEGTNKSNSQQIYNQFMEAAFRLHPRYVVMITKSGWLTKTAQGISEKWIDDQLNSNHYQIMHDFVDSGMCFPGVSIEGGVNYFLWNKDHNGPCEYFLHQSTDVISHKTDYLNSMGAGVFIRDVMANEILNRVVSIDGDYFKGDKNFSSLVSPKHFFDVGTLLTSNWRNYSLRRTDKYCVKYYLNRNIHQREYAWISELQMPKNAETVKLHKVFIPAARGGNADSDNLVLGYPFYGEPGSICSQTYLVIGYDPNRPLTKTECENLITYIHTRFFRYLVSIKKKTQNGPRGVYQFVPLQDFSKPWTDAELYKKYKLTKDEIAFIESMIKPMERGESDGKNKASKA